MHTKFSLVVQIRLQLFLKSLAMAIILNYKLIPAGSLGAIGRSFGPCRSGQLEQ